MAFLRRLASYTLVQMLIEIVASVAMLGVLQLILGVFPPSFQENIFGDTFANILYGVVIVVVFVVCCHRLEHRSLAEVGLPRERWLRPLMLGSLVGAGLMTAVVLLLAVTGYYHITDIDPFNVVELVALVISAGLLALLFWRKKKIGFWHCLLFLCLGFGLISTAAPLVLLIAAAVQEELIVRGIVFRHLEQTFGSWVAVVLSALFFGVIHIMNPGATLVSTVAIMVTAGLILAAIYMLTRSLWWAIGLHLAWNFFEGPVFGAPVTGKVIPGFFQAVFTGPDAWRGSTTFGPESGLVAILVVGGVGILLCIRAVRQGRIVKARRQWKVTDVPEMPVKSVEI